MPGNCEAKEGKVPTNKLRSVDCLGRRYLPFWTLPACTDQYVMFSSRADYNTMKVVFPCREMKNKMHLKGLWMTELLPSSLRME